MSKGSKQRPTDLDQFNANYDKIKWTPPEGMDGSCGFPFCQCTEKCLDKEPKNEQDGTDVPRCD